MRGGGGEHKGFGYRRQDIKGLIVMAQRTILCLCTYLISPDVVSSPSC